MDALTEEQSKRFLLLCTCRDADVFWPLIASGKFRDPVSAVLPECSLYRLGVYYTLQYVSRSESWIWKSWAVAKERKKAERKGDGCKEGSPVHFLGSLNRERRIQFRYVAQSLLRVSQELFLWKKVILLPWEPLPFCLAPITTDCFGRIAIQKK